MIYKRVPQCRVCTSQHGLAIDRSLLNRVPYQEIVELHQNLFTDPAKPLTKAVVFNHWQHMKEAVETVVAALTTNQQAAPAGSTALTYAGSPNAHDPARQRVFNQLVKKRLDEVQVMEELIESGLNDLKALAPDPTAPPALDDNRTKSLRNTIRRDTAMITASSANVKKISAQLDQEAEQAEKSRIVFRMFEIFRDSLESVPESVKGLVAERLKECIRRDIELNELLRASSVNNADDAEVLE